MRKLFLLLILVTQIVSALDLNNIKFEYITSDDGLSQNIVEVIFQDSKGYIWIGTRDGINRYNGLDFDIWRTNRLDSNSLVTNWVSAIAEDSQGNIWIGSEGLNIYYPEKDKMVRVPADYNNDEMYDGGRVYNITLDFDNTLWLATLNGLVHYFPETGKFKTYRGEQEGTFKGWNVYDVISTRDEKIFFATNADAIYEFDRKTETFIEHNYKQGYHGANFKKTIEEALDGRLYIGAEDGGMHIYDHITGNAIMLPVYVENGLNRQSLKCAALPLDDGRVLLGTDGGGINIYDPSDESIRYLVNNESDASSLSNNAIFSMLADRHGNLWVGHYGTGISIWKSNKEKFRSYFPNPLDDNSLSNGVVLAVFQDSRERIWIGHDGGGLSRFVEQENRFIHYRHVPGEEGALSTDVIVSIGEDPNGNLLLGTYGGGLMVFNPESGKVVRYVNNEDGLDIPHIWNIQSTSDGQYWLAILGAGYALYNPYDYSVKTKWIGQDESVCANVIFDILEQEPGVMWFGSEQQGLCTYNFNTSTGVRYSTHSDSPAILSSDAIKDIVIQDSILWIATDGGGLNRLNLNTDSVTIYSTAENLASNSLMGIEIDQRGNLWISSTSGMMKFNPGSGNVMVYDKTQGLQGNEFKYNAHTTLADGRMIFGGPNGITIFHPDSVKMSPIQPQIVFEELLIFNKPAVIGGDDSPLKAHIDNIDELTLKHKHRVFSLEYAALDYTTAENNQYRYMLEGFDNDWVEAGTRRYASYTNLPAGKYTFMVMASNSDGVWFEDAPRSIQIRVRPPWYRTKLFILFLAVSLAYIIYRIITKQKQAAQREKEILQKKIDEGQEVIDAKLQEIEKQQEDIRQRDINEKEIRFHNTGLALFGQIISKNRSNLQGLSQSFISELVNYIGADVGALFMAEKDDNNQDILSLKGRYCMDEEVESRDGILAGEGFIGTAFSKNETLIIDNLPDGYISLTSGLGSIPIKYAVFEPIVEEENVLGVIEIASLSRLPDYKVEFIGKVAQTIASVFALEKANEQTKKLLDDNSKKTEEIMAQEEELRIHIEELQASQEATQRREETLTEDLERKNKKIEELETLLKESGNK